MAIVPINGLFEAHLTVSDLDRSIAFYEDVVGLTLAHRVPARHAAFLWIGGRGRSMLGLWSIHSAPMNMRLHIAFNVSQADVLASVGHLRSAGLVPRDGGGGAAIDEPVVFAWMPAAAVYFDDPDGHSLEYISMIDAEPRPEWGRIGWAEWGRRTASG